MRVVILLLIATPAYAPDPCVSGVPVGKRPGPYSFLAATGPERGQPTCYICSQGDKPAAVVFARTLSDPLGKLLAKLDAEVVARKDAGYKAWMTHLAATADLDALAKWSQEQGLKAVPVGAYEDAAGPPAYTLADEADVTVLLFVKQKVVANFAFRDRELTDARVAEVLAAVPRLFEGKRPPLEPPGRARPSRDTRPVDEHVRHLPGPVRHERLADLGPDAVEKE